MTYRDELEAALHRAHESERALAEERAKTAVKDQQIASLQQQLGNAQSQLAVLQPAPMQGPLRGPHGASAVHPVVAVSQIALWVMALGAIVMIVALGSSRESDGVQAARMFGAIPFAAVAGQLTRTRPIGRYFASVALALLGAKLLIEFFFAAIWPAL